MVVRTGSAVTSLIMGDKVLIAGAACRNCRHCDDGHPAYCESHMAYCFSGGRPDGSTTARTADGVRLKASLFGGSTFARQTVALAASVRASYIDLTPRADPSRAVYKSCQIFGPYRSCAFRMRHHEWQYDCVQYFKAKIRVQYGNLRSGSCWLRCADGRKCRVRTGQVSS